MKKFYKFITGFLTSLLIFIGNNSFALTQAKDINDLVEKTSVKEKLVATIFIHIDHPAWQKFKSLIEEYEKTDKDVVFIVADLNDPQMKIAALAMGVRDIPIMLVSKNGRVLIALVGVPLDLKQMIENLTRTKQMVKKLSKQKKRGKK